jgi:hypothetical protein
MLSHNLVGAEASAIDRMIDGRDSLRPAVPRARAVPVSGYFPDFPSDRM